MTVSDVIDLKSLPKPPSKFWGTYIKDGYPDFQIHTSFNNASYVLLRNSFHNANKEKVLSEGWMMRWDPMRRKWNLILHIQEHTLHEHAEGTIKRLKKEQRR